MSSLAAARADNFYHPPDYDPSKGSLKKFTGAKGHNQYETHGIIRFELPIDGWCTGCERHYGKGTRWNAKKEPDGYYFSTRIWSFTMTCHSCPTKIVIATDPKNSDYEYRIGIRKMIDAPSDDKDLDEVSAVVQEKLDGLYHKGGHAAEEERQQKLTNTMWKMEREQDNRKKVATESERFETLVELGETRRLYDADANSALRQSMRSKRRAAESLVEETKAKQLSIPLLAVNDADIQGSTTAFSAVARSRKVPLLSKRMIEVAAGSVFGEASVRHKQSVLSSVTARRVPLLAAAKAAAGKFKREHQAKDGSSSPEKVTKIRKLPRCTIEKREGNEEENLPSEGRQQPDSLRALSSLYGDSDNED